MPPKLPPEPYKRYTDPTGEFSNRALDAATWYLTHKTVLQRVGFGVLGLSAAVFTVIAVAMWGEYLVVGMAQEKQIAVDQSKQFQNYEQIRTAIAASPVMVTGLQIFTSAPDTYDMVAYVQNPNKDWIAHLTYDFSCSGGTTTLAETTLLPMQSRPVTSLGQSLSVYPLDARLVLADISWERVNPHVVADIPGFMADHLIFPVDGLVFTHAAPGQHSLPVHDIHFTVTNASAYSYWEPTYYVELTSGGATVGMMYLTLDQFRAGETRVVDLRSFAPDLTLDSVTLYPLVNPFDPGVYMAPTS